MTRIRSARIRSVRIRSARIRSERIPSDRIRPVGAPGDMVEGREGDFGIQFPHLLDARILPVVGNQKSEAKSTGGNMAKIKKPGENHAWATLFDYEY